MTKKPCKYYKKETEKRYTIVLYRTTSILENNDAAATVIAGAIFMEILLDLVGMESLKYILQNMRLMRRKKRRMIE